MSFNAPVRVTTTPTLKNAPLISLAEGIDSFDTVHLTVLILGVPYITYLLLLVGLSVPIALAYCILASTYGKRKNQKVYLPSKEIEEFITINDPNLKARYHGKEKIPMQVFHDAYFEGKVDFNGDVLEILEQRHYWAKMVLTPAILKHLFMETLRSVIPHSATQDEVQVRGNYDRGDDFYSCFIGSSMVYSSGLVTNTKEAETLEQLQYNMLALICSKLNLQSEDRLLDVGCGWGSLVAFAAKNYGCSATGVTLSRNGTDFGNERIKKNGLDPNKARLLCMDYRDIPGGPGHYTKIVSLQMAEHVGSMRYGAFMRQMYDLLDDDGIFLLQVTGNRTVWQYEDIVFGSFLSKYIFPGADAFAPLGWVVNQIEAAGFEVKNIDVLGVHFSATVWRWYLNWVDSKDKVVEKYGERWYRLWVFFLAYSIIILRQGSCSVYQLTLHKNLNAYHRINGVPFHSSIHIKEHEQREWVTLE